MNWIAALYFLSVVVLLAKLLVVLHGEYTDWRDIAIFVVVCVVWPLSVLMSTVMRSRSGSPRP